MTVHEFPRDHGSLANLDKNHHPQYALVREFGKVRKTSDQTRLGGGPQWQTITWQSELDTSPFWQSATPNRLTANRDGVYDVGALLLLTVTVTGVVAIDLIKNGTTTVSRRRNYIDSSTTQTLHIADPLVLAAGDYIEVSLDFASDWTAKFQYGNGDPASYFYMLG